MTNPSTILLHTNPAIHIRRFMDRIIMLLWIHGGMLHGGGRRGTCCCHGQIVLERFWDWLFLLRVVPRTLERPSVRTAWNDSFQAEIRKPGTQNPGPGQVLKLTKVCSKPNPEKWCDDVTMSSHLYQVPGKSSHFWKYLKLFRNLAASHRTWNVTFCDVNVTSHVFVTVPHPNPGPGSGKISARNDPETSETQKVKISRLVPNRFTGKMAFFGI